MPVIDASVPRTFGEVLGSLMGSVIDAQAQAARSIIDFIEDVGTIGESDLEAPHDLRTVKFNYTKKDENGLPASYMLELPLLSIVDIPSINIKTAKFSFYYDVTDIKNETVKSQENSDVDNKAVKRIEVLKRKNVKVVGKISKESNSVSNISKNAGIKVDIEFERGSVPVGMERIIDMLELSAKETSNPKK